MKAGWAVLLSAAALSAAADKKIIINAIDKRNAWAFTDEAVSEYRNAAGQSADIVLARSPSDMARETESADGVIGGLSRDLFLKAKKLKWVQTYSAGVEGYRWPEFRRVARSRSTTHIPRTDRAVSRGATISRRTPATKFSGPVTTVTTNCACSL